MTWDEIIIQAKILKYIVCAYVNSFGLFIHYIS